MMLLDPIEEARPLGRILLDALLSTDLLGRYHVRLEAEETGLERMTVPFTEIADEALSPQEAIKFLKSREIMTAEALAELAEQYRPMAFTVAGIERMEVLDQVKQLLQEFLADDRGLEAFRTELGGLIERAGLLPLKPHHIENLFRTNMQTAYNAGRWQEIMSPEMEPFFPILEYHNPRDDRSRPAHAAMAKPGSNRYRRDDPIWAIWWPPNGYQCRCSVLTVSTIEVEEEGIVPDDPPQTTLDAQGREVPVRPDKGFDHNPGTAEGRQAILDHLRDRAINLGITRFDPGGGG